MAILSDLKSIDDMAAELADRFGPIPDPVDNLLFQLRIKVLAVRARISAVATESGQVQIRIPGGDGNGRMRLQGYLGGKAKVSRNSIWLTKGLSTHEWQVTLVQILEKIEGFEFEHLSEKRDLGK
jgi:transcription-repair coupling factor (superfamily II helicase)